MGDRMTKWHQPVLRVCKRPEATPLRPFIAQFLVHKVPLRVARASAAELNLLLGVIEAIALVPRGAELYLHQCLQPAMMICTSPDLGSSRGTKSTADVVTEYRRIRRRAAALISHIA